MPFWRKDKKDSSSADPSSDAANNSQQPKEKINYKARLEHKQYLAHESPEPSYDLSDCGLKAVPAGVYAKCKVLRKEALLLQNNELSQLHGGGVIPDLASVLQVLDLHSNLLERLPEEIGTLKELRVLYVHGNRLKRLPDSLGDLVNLQTLDVSQNNLKDLPSSLCNLRRLRSINVSSNPKLTRLDRSMANVRSLEKIGLDPEGFEYPEAKVCGEGTEAIMRFLCKECDIAYVPPAEFQCNEEKTSSSSNNYSNGSKAGGHGYGDDPYDRIVRGSLDVIEKQKEAKIREMLAMQQELELQQAREAQLSATLQSSKQRLLIDLAQDEARRDEAVKRLHELKEKERESLVNSLYRAEGRADQLIGELVASNARRNDPKRVVEEMEREKREMEEFFSIKAGEEDRLREKEVLREMQRLMEEEMRREQIRRQYEAGRRDIVDTALTTDLENDKAVDAVLQSKGKHQRDLISALLEDEKYQREAFSALFTRQDARHREICEQVQMIQNELASLTMVEMTKRDLRMEFERDAMAEKRETLTRMLLQLMEQKSERARELQARLREMEESKVAATENYWLIQYQKLLDSKPKSLLEAERSVDPALREVLEKAGAEEYIPVFALKGVTLKQLQYMKDRELSEELGIHNVYLRQKILLSAAEFAPTTPSAPPLAAEPSAPPATSLSLSSASSALLPSSPEKGATANPAAAPAGSVSPTAPPVETFQSNECVICLDRKCDIIFLPCGHVCCCWTCEQSVSVCPLCRAEIVQKVRLHAEI